MALGEKRRPSTAWGGVYKEGRPLLGATVQHLIPYYPLLPIVLMNPQPAGLPVTPSTLYSFRKDHLETQV